jgi:hypothetical protein
MDAMHPQHIAYSGERAMPRGLILLHRTLERGSKALTAVAKNLQALLRVHCAWQHRKVIRVTPQFVYDEVLEEWVSALEVTCTHGFDSDLKALMTTLVEPLYKEGANVHLYPVLNDTEQVTALMLQGIEDDGLLVLAFGRYRPGGYQVTRQVHSGHAPLFDDGTVGTITTITFAEPQDGLLQAVRFTEDQGNLFLNVESVSRRRTTTTITTSSRG